MPWTRTFVYLAVFGALAVGCQRLPDDSPPSNDDDPSGSTGSEFPPSPTSGGDTDAADSTGDDSTGEPPPADPTVCIEGLTRSSGGPLSDFAGVEIIDTSLTLTGVTDEDLAWLQCVQRVEGQLRIVESPALTSLHGLENLRVVEEELWLLRNDSLLDVDALSGLEEVGSLLIKDHTALGNLNGVAAVGSVGRLAIRSNPQLTTIAFPGLTTLSDLAIYDNAQVNTLDFGALTHVEGTVGVGLSPALTDLTGFAALSEVGELGIGLTGVQTTADLSALRIVEERVLVNEATGLETLDLPALERTTFLQVLNSPDLVRIDLPSITQLEEIELMALEQLIEPPDLSGSQGLHSLRVQELAALTSLAWAGTMVADSSYILVTDAPLLADLASVASVSTLSVGLYLQDLPALSDLSDLSALQGVDGRLHLQSLPLIDSLGPLSSLTSIGEPTSGASSGLIVEQLDALTTFDGLESLASVDGVLSVVGNDSLNSMAAISSLATLEEVLIDDNAVLSSLAGLETLQAATTVQITNNPMLSSLTGLAGMEVVVTLTIGNNDQVVDLAGLDGLQSIGVDLHIVENAALTNIDGLWPIPAGVLESIGGPVEIRGNSVLSQCAVDEFLVALAETGWSGDSDVTDNQPCPE